MNATMTNAAGNQIKELTGSASIPLIGLVIALIIFAVIARAIRARFQDGDDPADADRKILQQMEDLKRQGDLSEEEYRSIKSQIFNRRQW